MGDDYEYVSFKSPKTIVAETVYHFFRGGLYGAAFGLVGLPILVEMKRGTISVE